MEHMEKAICQEYRQLNCIYKKRIESDSEVLLFTGLCYNFGKSGHCTNDFKKKNYGQRIKKEKFLGKSNNCGLRGYTDKDCWDKEENKNKRQAGWKRSQKGDSPSTIKRKQELKIDGHRKINSRLKTFYLDCRYG
jgi:hypothetical protein